MKITLRHFKVSKETRRNSVVTEEFIFSPKPLGVVRLRDLILQTPDLSNCHFARGTTFLKDDDILQDGDLLNVFA